MFLFKYQSKHVRLPHHCPLHFAKENHKSCSSRNHAILISSSAFRKKQTHRFAGPTRVNMVRPRDMLCYVLTSQKRPPACGMLEVRTNLRTFPRSERKEGRPYWTRWPKLLMGVHIFPLEAGGPLQPPWQRPLSSGPPTSPRICDEVGGMGPFTAEVRHLLGKTHYYIYPTSQRPHFTGAGHTKLILKEAKDQVWVLGLVGCIYIYIHITTSFVVSNILGQEPPPTKGHRVRSGKPKSITMEVDKLFGRNESGRLATSTNTRHWRESLDPPASFSFKPRSKTQSIRSLCPLLAAGSPEECSWPWTWRRIGLGRSAQELEPA